MYAYFWWNCVDCLLVVPNDALIWKTGKRPKYNTRISNYKLNLEYLVCKNILIEWKIIHECCSEIVFLRKYSLPNKYTPIVMINHINNLILKYACFYQIKIYGGISFFIIFSLSLVNFYIYIFKHKIRDSSLFNTYSTSHFRKFMTIYLLLFNSVRFQMPNWKFVTEFFLNKIWIFH